MVVNKMNNEMEDFLAWEIIDNKKILTVWIALDDEGEKIFETIIFDDSGKYRLFGKYATVKRAQEGHEKAVKWVKDGCKYGG